jgi:hypothetical protein
MLRYIYAGWGDRVKSLMMWSPCFPQFAQSIHQALRGCPFDNLIGFPDGTFTRCCAPGGAACVNINMPENECYSGYKKLHGFNTCMIMLPNGLVVANGIFTGNTHDSTALKYCRYLDELEDYWRLTGRVYALFGDSGLFPSWA